jgi:glutamate racemase
VIEPGARAAAQVTKTGHVAVIGTPGTVKSGAYQRALVAERADIKVEALACPLFVPLAEEGWADDQVATLVAQRYLGELFARDPQIDTLVLGCTHYPLLRDTITRVARQLAAQSLAVVDSATAMAEAARATLATIGNRRNGPGRLDCFATDTSRLDELAPRFLGEALTGFELVDL